MKLPRLPIRLLALLGVLVPLFALLLLVAFRSGPLAPVSVTVAKVERRALAPALFGIGAVEARYSYRLGPTAPGRLLRLDAQVGDRVRAGQRVGEMDPVDLEDRLRSVEAATRQAEATVLEAAARDDLAQTQLHRYEQLFASKSISEEALTTRRQEARIAEAARRAAQEAAARARSDREALLAQRRNLLLVAPADGIVTLRPVEPGTTVMAGQLVLELMDPSSLWLDVKFDQTRSAGLAAGRPARVHLRSRANESLSGRVLRVEPRADEITEEMLAKVVLDRRPEPLPPLGELAEVTVALPALPPTAVIPTAAVHRLGARTGVWKVTQGKQVFTPVRLGMSDLEGHVQALEGLEVGESVLLHSEKPIGPGTRLRVVAQIPGGRR